MPLYQLRLPQRLTLEGWLDDITWLVWYELMHHSPLEALAPHAFVRIRELLRDLLEQHVTTYHSCGLWSYCRVGTTPSPWMPTEAFHPEEPGTHWYLLDVRQELGELVARATNDISTLLFTLLGTAVPPGVIELTVETALRRGIGRYLYQNPRCGTNPFCQGRVSINPWRRHGDDLSLFRPLSTQSMI